MHSQEGQASAAAGTPVPADADDRTAGGQALLPGRKPASRPFASRGRGLEGLAIDREAVRRDYEQSSLPVRAIFEKYGITEWQLKRLQREGKWTLRPQRGRGPLPGVVSGFGQEAIESRLNRLITIGLATVEEGVGREGFDEGKARMVSELCRAARTMRDVNKKAEKARETKTDESGRSLSPAQILRELAERFDCLPESDARGEGGDPQDGERGGSG